MSSSEIITDIMPAVTNTADNTEIIKLLNTISDMCISINDTLVVIVGLVFLACLLYVTFRFF